MHRQLGVTSKMIDDGVVYGMPQNTSGGGLVGALVLQATPNINAIDLRASSWVEGCANDWTPEAFLPELGV